MNSIVQQFDQAAETYDQHSSVQREIAVEFGGRLVSTLAAPQRIFEIGCGTGHLTRELVAHFPDASIVATDASQKMIEIAQDLTSADNLSIQPWIADRQHAELPGEFDLIVSSMAFQWFSDLQRAATEFASKTKCFAMTIPIEGTFADWISAHHQLGMKPGVRELLTQQQVSDWLEQLPEQLEGEYSVEEYSIHFDRPLEFVQSLRRIGAHASSSDHSPVNLKRVFALFPEGIEVQYSIAFITIQNKD